MKVIYIAGPYRAPTEWGRQQNIRHAEAAMIRLLQKGWAVICPHKNSADLGGCVYPDPTGVETKDDTDWLMWLVVDSELLRRCDAIYMLEGWPKSKGACAEYRLAAKLGKEIIYEDERVAKGIS